MLHNTIDRLTNTTPKTEGQQSLFTTTEIFATNSNSGLFFLIDGDEQWTEIVFSALRFLSHVGFGGDGSIGKNSFSFSVEDYNFGDVSEANAFVSLSIYLPTKEELEYFAKNKKRTWYELETRKGKFGGQFIKQNRFWKDSVLAFKEGSVFPALNKNVYGQNKIVLSKEESGHFDVYQYGIAFNLPIKVK